MNIIGTIYLVDEKRIDVLKTYLATTPPPGGRIATGTMLCMDMDETDDLLEMQFPQHCQKATLLCPPPLAMYREIDGDAEGFIQEYNDYLDHDSSVQEFIASMLLFLHIGGNILLYTPSDLDDDVIWINTLMMFFYTRYGISIGGPHDQAAYDPRYDEVIADTLYTRGIMDVFDYIASSNTMMPSIAVSNRLAMDLRPYCGTELDPMDLFVQMKTAQINTGAIAVPGIAFKM